MDSFYSVSGETTKALAALLMCITKESRLYSLVLARQYGGRDVT